MNRVRSWDVDLGEWAATQIGQPFTWGTTDCASLVITGQRLIYGVDIFQVPAYKGKVKALRVLADMKAMRSVLQSTCNQVGRRFLQAGDIALVKNGCTELETDGLLLVVRDYALLTEPSVGVVALPLDMIPDTSTYWRVDVG